MYDKLCELLDTLNEAFDILVRQNETAIIDQLVGDIRAFITNIIEFSAPAEECLTLRSELKRIYDALGNEDAEIDLYEFRNNIETYLEEIYADNCIPDSLNREEDFVKYLDKLNWFTKDHCIIIFSSNTPSGSPDFTYAVAQKLCSLGTGINLYDKFRASYVAIIDDGKLVAEDLRCGKSLEVNRIIGNMQVSVKSIGFESTDANYRHSGATISIDGVGTTVWKLKDKLNSTRGIAFLVYNKETLEMVDFTIFDTYAPGIPCRRDYSKRIKDIVDQNPGIVFMSIDLPIFPEKPVTENEEFILTNKINFATVCQYPRAALAIQQYIPDVNDIPEVLNPPSKAYIGIDGARHYEDYKGKYFNIVNGHRITVDQPKSFKRTIYVMGPCYIMGVGVRDEGTYSSQLQMLLNKYAADKGFIVENYGLCLDGLNAEEEMINLFNTFPLKSGDIVIGLGSKYHAKNDELVTDPYKYGELFFDVTHLTEAAHKMIAEGVFRSLEEHSFFEDYLDIAQPEKQNTAALINLSPEQSEKLNAYRKKISDIWENDMHRSENVGAIVMNCNPFTLGHRYLIETAAKECEYLVIFVVQEDRSFFPFKDRIELVRQGTKDLKNVIVVESGEFIISSLTFEGYFNKSQLQDRVIDTSNDVTLFAKEIAPAANIKIRFAGSEPLDNVTNQYNREMEKILPLYDIEFREISRKTNGNDVISASEVRRLLKENQWDKLHEFVPTATFDYLKKKFSS